MKVCRRCLVEKDLTEFRRQYRSGHEHVCMSCNANKVKHYERDGVLGKTCRKCDVWQSLECYHKDKSKSDGLHSYCKTCQIIKTSNNYADNIEERRIKGREYYRDNPEKFKVWARAREKKISTHVGFSQKQWLELCAKYDNKCLCCKQVKKLTIDHVVPISKGGKHEIDNVQPLCLPCNRKKYTKIIDYRPK